MQNKFILKYTLRLLAISFLAFIIMSSATSCVNSNSADARINDMLNSKYFLTLSKCEQIENTKNLLNDLRENNLLQNDIQFDSEDLLFTFKYSDNTLGGIDLSPKISDIDGFDPCISDTNDAIKSLINNEIAFADCSQRNIHILFALDRSFRKYYIDLEQEWEYLGLDVSVDYQVTVKDLTRLSGYDCLIFSMHGTTYETKPVLCLLEGENQNNRNVYQEYLDNRLVAGVYNSSGGMYRKCYWVLPEFFRYVYENNELSNTCILAESCEFLGMDGKSNVELDSSFPNNFKDAGAACTFGFRNPVLKDYSMEMVSSIVENMIHEHSTVGEAFEKAKIQHESNNFPVINDGAKYSSVPYIFGDTKFSLMEEY